MKHLHFSYIYFMKQYFVENLVNMTFGNEKLTP